MVLSNLYSYFSALASDSLQLAWEEGGGVIAHRTLRCLQIQGSEWNADGKILSEYSKLPLMSLLPSSVLAYP